MYFTKWYSVSILKHKLGDFFLLFPEKGDSDSETQAREQNKTKIEQNEKIVWNEILI